MTWQPHVTVATVIEDNGKFLLVEERCNGQLVFNQPAGHLDPDESLIQAAARETLEETGWTVDIAGVVGAALYTSPHNNVTYHRTTFFATPLSHNSEQNLDDGIERVVWMTLEQMHEHKAQMRSELVITAVEQYLDGHRYPLSMIYDSLT